MITVIDCGVSITGVSVLVAVALRLATKPCTGPVAVSSTPEARTVTAGNSSQITDGAAAVLVMSAEKARTLGMKILGYVRSYAFAGLDPARMGLGPSVSTPRALKLAGLSFKDIQLLEINEAFAAQVIANEMVFRDAKLSQKWLSREDPIGEINRDILNVNGGAIALGHPVGSSGTRLVLTLLKEMKRRHLNLGLAALCVGGGQGAAMVVERA